MCRYLRNAGAALLIGALGCSPNGESRDSEADAGAEASRFATAADPIEPIPTSVDVDPAKAALGKRLFGEPLLSRDAKITCKSCHNPDSAFTDGQAKPDLEGREKGAVNVGTILNIAYNFRFNWNGAYRSMEAQLDTPILGDIAMDAPSWDEVVRRLREVPSYAEAFGAIYADGVTEPNVRDAIVSYQRTLTTPDAPFDRYLRGEKQQGGKEFLNEQEVEGYDRFKELGCISCHQGRNIGGNMYQKIGVMDDYFAKRGTETVTADHGLWQVTKREEDDFVFRVPSLRNVALTAPYFHDGSEDELSEAIVTMGQIQLGVELSEHDVAVLEAFLRSLTGKQPN